MVVHLDEKGKMNSDIQSAARSSDTVQQNQSVCMSKITELLENKVDAIPKSIETTTTTTAIRKTTTTATEPKVNAKTHKKIVLNQSLANCERRNNINSVLIGTASANQLNEPLTKLPNYLAGFTSCQASAIATTQIGGTSASQTVSTTCSSVQLESFPIAVTQSNTYATLKLQSHPTKTTTNNNQESSSTTNNTSAAVATTTISHQDDDNNNQVLPQPFNSSSTNHCICSNCFLSTDAEIQFNSNRFSFWKSLSNLPKSFAQRYRPNSPSDSDLAPEVVGYIASKRRCNQQTKSETETDIMNTTTSLQQPTDSQSPSEAIAMSSIPKTTKQSNTGQSNNYQVKLSIATTTTSATSSNSSLSSCILSDSTISEVRIKWGKKMDFLLSIIGFAVDLANIWRFPYLVYKNGGGVFLIPYLIMLVFGGIPLFFLELCLGQFVKKGPITVWDKICPAMKGVGYCSVLISWYVSFYYNVLIAWSVYFIYRSLLSIGDKMPWEDCDNSWNSPSTCVSILQMKTMCSTRNESLESCRKDLFNNINVTSPATEFFVKELSQIDQSTGLNDMGYLRTELVVCTMIVYLLHYFSLFKGLETSGKVVWVTATAPYMILSILLVRGLFLPGASMGVEYYLSPKLEKLADPQVWIDAAGQVFYSIGAGFGVHLTYASFNSHDNNCYRDCLLTSAVNAATSVYSGLVVFVYLGYMATNLGIEIDKVASEGYSLVFEVYPEALTTLPFARFWSILFFIMLLTLGIDSALGGLEAVITGLEDEFKFARRLTRGQLTGLVIISSFLPALISCTQGGAYTLFWFDIYSAGVSLLFSALFETIGVVYCYGLDKFILNIESMLGKKPHIFYILCWKYISPLFLGVVIFMSIYTASVPVYRNYTFPLWSVILGWCLAFSSVAAIPIVAILYWCTKKSKALTTRSPSKSPRKREKGADSVASSRHGVGSRKSPSQYKSVSVSCGDQANSATRSTAITTTLTSHDHHHYDNIVDKNLHKIGEEML